MMLGSGKTRMNSMILQISQPAVRATERSYAIDVLLGEFLGLRYTIAVHESPDVKITLAGDVRRELWLPDVFLSEADACWLSAESLPSMPLKMRPNTIGSGKAEGGEQLPVLFGRECPPQLRMPNANSAYLDVDVFGSAFFMLSRYEEAIESPRDGFDRFPAHAATAVKGGFLERPLVNEYLELLWSTIRRLWPNLECKPRAYRCMLSHDVDEASHFGHSAGRIVRSVGADLLVRKEPRLAWRRAWNYGRARLGRYDFDGDPYNTFPFVMEVSERHGLHSAFYFVGSVQPCAFDPGYDLERPWMKALLRNIHERGHEVGLHGSFESAYTPELLAKEWRKLLRICDSAGVRQGAWGGRQHYLRWKNPETWKAWSDLGLEYDSTLSHAEQAGFRCGCCYEYPAFNVKTRTKLQLRERPLVAMEGTLLSYMGCSLREMQERLAGLVAICRRFQGDFTLLWHPNGLIGKQMRSAYEAIVEIAA